MTDYEKISAILTRENEFFNPCDDICDLFANAYKKDWNTDKLLLNDITKILLVFTPEGKYKYTTITS